MTRRARITQRLTEEMQPSFIDIRDDSDKHASHGNVPAGALETHLHLIISASQLNDKSRVEQHRSIMQLLGDEFDSGLHALSIEVRKTA